MDILRSKDDAGPRLRQWISNHERRVGRSVKNMRLARGGAFIDGELQKWLKFRGVTHKTTPTYTSQGNAITDRMNRTLQDTARSILQHMQLSPSLWAKAISLASYLRYRCQVTGVPKTPEELWSRAVPKVDHLQSFGCKLYMRHEKQERQGKMGALTWVGVLVG